VPELGIIADDFTGATDIATGFAARRRRAVVVTGPAGYPASADADVVVVALKSRTAPVDAAVADSLAALERLRALGCRRFAFKYCSTFDSTDRGNIGPVLDALAARTEAARVIVVPAFPANGRTVYQGHLFVGDRLLEDSPMRHHPLTPMTRSRLVDLLAPQTSRPVGQITLAAVRGDLAGALAAASEPYLALDAVTDADLAAINEATRDDVLVSGAAGLAVGTPEGGTDPGDAWCTPPGRNLVLCGSASARTREQIAHAAAHGAPTLRLDVDGLAERPGQVVDEVLSWADRQQGAPIVYATGVPDDIRAGAAGRTEVAFARIAAGAVRRGFTRLVVAGGETSGAVVRGLDVGALHIGPTVAPGVCWARGTTAAAPVALALKSGNFGAPDMFSTAWQALP
jgi:3-dehydrotetronate 4-kinase